MDIGEKETDPMDIGEGEVLDVGVTTAQVGREILDIAANFGFDIPDESLIPDQMSDLINTEISLAKYKPGNPDELYKILNNFLKAKEIMNV